MRARAIIAVLLAALAAAIVAPAALAAPTPEAALANLNGWRAQLGLPAVSTLNSAWNTGCQHHNNYEHVNGNALTHTEEMGHGGYTADGAEAGANSVLAAAVSAPSPTATAALLPGPVWDGAVFHRAQLLQPRLAQTGFDSTTFEEAGPLFRSFTCMRTLGTGALDNTRTAPGLTLYPSPGNGAYGVPTTFPGNESPNPAAETGVPAGSTLGWLLNVEINGPWADAGFGYTVFAHGVTATLAPDGTSNFVPLVVSQCGPSGCGGAGGTSEGAYFQGGFGIFPTQALAADTTYRVVLTAGTVTDNAAHLEYPLTGYSWCFSTGAVYAASADCSAPSTAAQEPSTANASTTPNFTPYSPPAANPPAAAALVPTTPTTRATPKPALCHVPKLAGKSLKALKKKLVAAHCKLGKVTKKDGATAKDGTASHQSAKPGKSLPAGTKVNVTLTA
jgi:hypothetical protein